MFACSLRPFLRHLAISAVLALSVAHSDAQVNSEQQIKAAFLINFLKYIEWPSTTTSATLCLFGRDQLGPFLTNYEGRLIAGRELRIRRINSPDHMADCQLVYLPDTEEARFGAVLRWVENQPTLTVSDAEFFTHQGGGISLIRAEGRLQFDVNTNVLNHAGLKPSSQMMRLARQVIGTAR